MAQDTIDIQTVLQNNNFSRNLNTIQNLGPSITRAEIESVLTENSLSFPTVSVIFFIINTSRFFLVNYDSVADQYTSVLMTASN